ncbi:transmembrane protein 50A [Neodiprion pinetum]|uniref:Transmembrane protein 50A n=1 Tax=Neodiprion lecontei TaxID=441921 RepID=A0A6J0B9A3_NEOLC|nr:transmembrane protein 50A [Neodiprion lecontei]XP_046431524.1 transmembrane protein 50A [Neodiprion fabricii]XP_046488119.1 transmembrane protein 50A [Neodiprion pinetum]XP_046625267.1 transmembrane protein 50A [Neodiprion virginianus]
MASCLENIQIPACVWFDGGEKRNSLMSMLAGTLFFMGWWFIIDAQAKYPYLMLDAYHVCGVFGTISLFMVNSVTNAQIRGDAYNGGCLGVKGARGWLFIGFVMGFAAVIAACWILFTDFIRKDVSHTWPGVGLFLQNVFIFVGSLTYKFGRSEDQWG